MAGIGRAKLFGKLNNLGYKSMESATIFCKMRGNPYVELVHWLHQMLQLQDSDIRHIANHFDLDVSHLATDITTNLENLNRGATSISDISPHLEQAVERGWVYASLAFGEPGVRSGHIICGILQTQGLTNVLNNISSQFTKLKGEELLENFDKIVGGSPEEGLGPKDGSSLGSGVGSAPVGADGKAAPAAMGKQDALNLYTVDLTAKAKSGEMDPIVGRDDEIRQIVDILMRRRQNNPILTGEAGVGKTAVVEGFAQRLAANDVPPPLHDVTLRSLDMGLLQAGASVKGEFENRLKQIIEEVQSSPTPIIMFIDEAHTLIGAGGAAGSGDAANLLKPALARGTLRTIAATTWAEYRKYIEKDPALTRRFQTVKVGEPTEDKAILMLRNLSGVLEDHHKVQVLDAGVEAAVRLSHRYIPARQLPDKAVSLIDTACARVAISQHGVPASIEDTRRNIEAMEREAGILEREERLGSEHSERQNELKEKLAAARTLLEELEGRWNDEKDRVSRILELRNELRKEPVAAEGEEEAPANAEDDAKRGELRTLQSELQELQGDSPLILPSVDTAAVASVVADWTGIPVGRMQASEIGAVLSLADTLEERVIGQRHALDIIARRIKTSRAGLDNPSKPVGVFLLAGPSGVGKTETALALGDALYGGESNVITINMSEFQEAHTVSTLKGAPPGYVGYGEGGILTEAVRRRPYSIVLLDEVEKAHSDVHEIFFQVFDKGVMEDGEGRTIDFKNTIILLTSNVGTDLVMSMCEDPELLPDPEGIAQALREPMLKVFPPALLGRLVTIPYYPLGDDVMKAIIKLQLGRIEKRLRENRKLPFSYDPEVVDIVHRRCTEVESGGRMVDAILTNTLLPQISEELLNRVLEGREIARVHVGAEGEDFTYSFD